MIEAAPTQETETKNEEEKDDGNGGETLSDGEPFMEIGTWSNEMANNIQTFSTEFETNYASSSGMVMAIFFFKVHEERP